MTLISSGAERRSIHAQLAMNDSLSRTCIGFTPTPMISACNFCCRDSLHCKHRIYHLRSASRCSIYRYKANLWLKHATPIMIHTQLHSQLYRKPSSSECSHVMVGSENNWQAACVQSTSTFHCILQTYMRAQIGCSTPGCWASESKQRDMLNVHRCKQWFILIICAILTSTHHGVQCENALHS